MKRRTLLVSGAVVGLAGCVQTGNGEHTDRRGDERSVDTASPSPHDSSRSDGSEDPAAVATVKSIELRRYLRIRSGPSAVLLGDNEHFFVVLRTADDGPTPEDIRFLSGSETPDVKVYSTGNVVAVRVPNGSYSDARLRYGSTRELDLGSRLQSPGDQLPRFRFHDVDLRRDGKQITVQVSVSNDGSIDSEAYVKISTSFFSDVNSFLSLPVPADGHREYIKSPDILHFDNNYPDSGDIFLSYGGNSVDVRNQFDISNLKDMD